MKKRIIKANYLYYVGFLLTVILFLINASTLIEISDKIYRISILIISGIYSLKVLNDGHTKKELLLFSLLFAAMIVLYYCGAPAFLVLFFLGSIAIKGINIRRVVQIDITIKIVFLLTHVVLYTLNCVADGLNVFAELRSGTQSGSLYFSNPNNVGMIGIWIAIDWLLLIKNKTIKSYVIPTVFALLIYAITFSRTSIGVFAIYLVMQFIKNDKKLTIISRSIFALCTILSVYIITSLSIDNTFVAQVNHVLSGRIWYSITAYKNMGIHMMPFNEGEIFMRTYIVDNFYVKCFVYYGIITLFAYFAPYILLTKSAKPDVKRISIISAICMLFENTTANIGLALPYLVMADAIVNKSKIGVVNKSKKEV